MKAYTITAEEATWPKIHGECVVEISSGEQHWGVFQGSKEACEELEKNLNEGFEFFERQAKASRKKIREVAKKELPSERTLELRKIRKELLRLFPNYKVTQAKNKKDCIHLHNDDFALYFTEEQEAFMASLEKHYYFEQKNVIFGIDIYGYKKTV